MSAQAGGMKIYLVGGAVRDALLDEPVTERDWVVVGGDEAAMRARDFVPADREFPVFLHPESGEEFALARREVKRGEGYRGFDVHAGPDVTLEEDLRRRDLTINAMARDENGTIIDPYGGREDLEAGVLRHVSEAFVEDPVRVLRVARFAARLAEHGFHIAHTTFRLMRRMVDDGEMQHLNAERVWREMLRAMKASRPWRFFEVLHHCGALQSLVPVLAAAMGPPVAHGSNVDSRPMAALRRAASADPDPGVRLAAALLPCVGSPVDADNLAGELRADRATAQLLRRAIAGRTLYEAAARGNVDALFELAVLWRGFDRDAEITRPLVVCEAQTATPVVGCFLHHALPAARAITAAGLQGEGATGAELGRRLARARRDAMHEALQAAGLVT